MTPAHDNGASVNLTKLFEMSEKRWNRWCARCQRKHTSNEGCKFRAR